jgi:hypothetical protein
MIYLCRLFLKLKEQNQTKSNILIQIYEIKITYYNLVLLGGELGTG